GVLNDGVLVGASVSTTGQVTATDAHVSATGAGAITIQGTAGSGSGSGNGIDLETAGSAVSSTGTGDITLTTDSLVLNTPNTDINAGTNLVTLRQKTDVALTVDAMQQTGHLSLTDAELGRITAGQLALGRNDTGFTKDLTINSPITTHAGFSSL